MTSPPATPPAAGEKKPDAPAAVAAPAKYEFTLPEGFKAESVAEVEALARKLDLPQDKAQALLDHQAATVKTFVEGQRAELTQLANTWHDQVKADPKLGGANFEKTQIDARKALQRFGDQELVTALHETGYTNFPPLVRFVAAIGAAIGEDGIVRGAAPASDKSLGEIFYPNMTKKS